MLFIVEICPIHGSRGAQACELMARRTTHLFVRDPGLTCGERPFGRLLPSLDSALFQDPRCVSNPGSGDILAGEPSHFCLTREQAEGHRA